MKSSDFILPLIVSIVLHITAVSSGVLDGEAKIVLQKGASAVRVNIVPSVASKATLPPEDIEKTENPVAEKKIAPPEPELVKAEPKEDTPPEVAPDTPIEPKPSPIQEEPVPPEEHVDQSPAPDQQEESPVEPQIAEPKPAQLARADIPLEADNSLPDIAAINSRNTDGDLEEQGVDIPASVAAFSKPVYPRYSRVHGEEGTVVIAVEIFANGKPGKTEIVDSSGYQRLDKAAMKAIRKAKFVPAKIAGAAVTSTKRFAFKFDLDD